MEARTKTKRIRDDPNEYLGGDITGDISFVETEDGEEKRPATKAEKNEKRRKANKEWKISDRLVDSGKDPNPRHTLYYKQQLPCLKTEWNDFQESLCSPLPVTFRFGGSCPKLVEKSIQKRVSSEFRTMRGRYVELNGAVLTDGIVKPISWCKSWQIAADSGTFARSEALSPLYDLLCREVSLGNVVRQELASMIPVLLLDVHHNHTVLDVCAAPGSKTEQILATMQQHGKNHGLSTMCTGMVVANDADPKRILTLKKRYSRCGRPNLLINCSRAEDLYRSIKGKFKFDRIVADVPCSGDGTFRKFSHLWRLFRPRVSLELHLIQLQIAKASALMLKAGGRMIYSTCSINPLEDEAVVAALLLYCNGKLKLVDVAKEGLLPGLKKRQGISDWECNDDIFTVGEADDAARQASKSRLMPFVASMYPPSPEVAVQLHLDRCIRILPHDQDTGGFFVAVLEMVRDNEMPVPIVLPAVISCEVMPVTDNEDYVKNDQSTKKKVATGISEARTLQTFKSLGFNAKSRRKEKLKKSADKEEGLVKVKLDSSPCTLYTSLDSSFTSCRDILHFDDSNLSNGLVGVGVVDPKGDYSLISAEQSASCCLVIATSVTLPVVIDKVVTGEDVLTVEEEERLKLKKLQQKSRDSNGIFGSRSTGWLKVQAADEDEEDNKPYKKVQMISKCVEQALRTWARSDMVIEAGVTVCHHQDSSKIWKLEPDGARALLPHIKADRVVFLKAADFSFFLRQGVEQNGTNNILIFQDGEGGDEDNEEEDGVTIGVEVETVHGDVRKISDCSSKGFTEECLSADARNKLWSECTQRLDDISDSPDTSFTLIVAIAPPSSSSSSSSSSSNSCDGRSLSTQLTSTVDSSSKKRLSKAEKKNKKADMKKVLEGECPESVTNATSVPTDELDEEGSMVLVLTVTYNVVDERYDGIRLNTVSGGDVCNSYLAAILSLKI